MTALPGPIHVILPVHNRREVTLRCLRHLRATGVDAWAQLVVVDDGSTDGTADAIRAEFPRVTLLPGDGQLFWTGATAAGMRHAVSQGTACCVWLNDDSHPVPGAVERVVRRSLEAGGVTAGLGRLVAFTDAEDFPAYRKTCWGESLRVAAPAPDGVVDVDACRGNLVAIPRAVVEAIGYPDERNLPQYLADTDYTLRATAAGFRCVLDQRAVVEETVPSGPKDESWLTTNRSIAHVWRRVFVKNAGLYWRAQWVYRWRHWGPVRGPLLFAVPYARLALATGLRMVLPLAWRRRLSAGVARRDKAV